MTITKTHEAPQEDTVERIQMNGNRRGTKENTVQRAQTQKEKLHERNHKQVDTLKRKYKLEITVEGNIDERTKSKDYKGS